MATITVDCDKTIGRIKPMHGVGQPPIVGGADCTMFRYLSEASIPYSRLHDVGGMFGGGRFVDIPNLFRDFDADPEDPEAYDFAFTDILIRELVENGVEPFFRLGVTIENSAKIKAYHIYPPKDSLKWAKICEGIIRHYTQGWANGFRYKINYWEIWNEPDNYEDPMENQMWRGCKEQYYELYGTASKYLKEKFPDLKIGGYSSCGFYALTRVSRNDGSCNTDANSSSRYEYFIEFLDGFLDYIKKHDCPLDFFSWHSYGSIEENIIFTEYVGKRLDEAGYQKTEQILNEWNCRPGRKGTLEHASLTAGMMLALQDTSLDSAMFYDARCGLGTYSGMFEAVERTPYPAYYAFVAFGELYKRGRQVEVVVEENDLYAAAAYDEDGFLMIANTNEQELELQLQGFHKMKKCILLAEGCIWCECELPKVLPSYSVLGIFFD